MLGGPLSFHIGEEQHFIEAKVLTTLERHGAVVTDP